MEKWEGAFITATETIESSHLSAIEKFALRNFIVNAKSPADAGQYVEDRISQNSDYSVEETLRSIRADVKTLALKRKDNIDLFITWFCLNFILTMVTVNREHSVAPDIDAALRERENQRCCITGWRKDVQPTYIVSPSILKDSDLQPGV